MTKILFIVFLMTTLVTSGCSQRTVQPPQVKDEKLANQQQWMAQYQNQDKAAMRAALDKASDRGRATRMELAALKATTDKMMGYSHQPNFSAVTTEDQRIQELRRILLEAEDAKTRMRNSNYKLQFQPNW